MDVVDIVYQIIQRRWRGLPVYRMADVHNVHNVHILNHQDGGLPATPPPSMVTPRAKFGLPRRPPQPPQHCRGLQILICVSK